MGLSDVELIQIAMAYDKLADPSSSGRLAKSTRGEVRFGESSSSVKYAVKRVGIAKAQHQIKGFQVQRELFDAGESVAEPFGIVTNKPADGAYFIYADAGNTIDRIPETASGEEYTRIARKVVSVFAGLSTLRWKHGDIREGNILLSPDCSSVFLIDFEMAEKTEENEPEAAAIANGQGLALVLGNMLKGHTNIDFKGVIKALCAGKLNLATDLLPE